MKKQIKIEDELFENHSKLIEQEDSTITATIIDAELDAIECIFQGDNVVEINTKDLTYLCLTEENLKTLLRLISEAKEHIYNM